MYIYISNTERFLDGDMVKCCWQESDLQLPDTFSEEPSLFKVEALQSLSAGCSTFYIPTTELLFSAF